MGIFAVGYDCFTVIDVSNQQNCYQNKTNYINFNGTYKMFWVHCQENGNILPIYLHFKGQKMRFQSIAWSQSRSPVVPGFKLFRNEAPHDQPKKNMKNPHTISKLYPVSQQYFSMITIVVPPAPEGNIQWPQPQQQPKPWWRALQTNIFFELKQPKL